MEEPVMIEPSEREKLQDCLLLLQSARKIIAGLGSIPDPWAHEMEKCFKSADEKLTLLLHG
jgi:hypothetical protein